MQKVLIANRGEIAVRIIKSCRALGITTAAVYSSADRRSPHALAADEAHYIGPAAATESYLNAERIVEVAKSIGADGVHPGYGFLSENPDFAQAVCDAGITFIGPSPEAMRSLGRKNDARELAIRSKVPIVPGYHSEKQDPKHLIAEAKKIGFPIMVKAFAGGGGRGMRLVGADDNLADAIDSAKREAEAAFGDGRLILEALVRPARHIEVQVIGDQHGNVLHLFERECSLQRRHQKVIEESPAPRASEEFRSEIVEAALAVAREAKLSSATTMEFIVPEGGSRDGEFYFLEANCRIQVEHPVTEMITGVDLVELQLRVARGEKLPLSQQDIARNGAAIEARVYAELPALGFRPTVGRIADAPQTETAETWLRIEHALAPGLQITTNYDPMLAKVVAHGKDREEARHRLIAALKELPLSGIETNIPFLVNLLQHPVVIDGQTTTEFIEGALEELTNYGASDDSVHAALAVALTQEIDVAAKANDPFRQTHKWFPQAENNQDVGRPALRYQVRGLARQESYTCLAKLLNVSRNDGVLERCIVEVDEKQFDCQVLERGSGARGITRIAIDGKPLQVRTVCDHRAKDDNASLVQLELTTFAIERLRPEDRDEETAAGNRLNSPLPGKVVTVNVAVGDEFKNGEPLVVIESMKMEHAIYAPRDGAVEELHVEPGAMVGEGEMLVVIKQSA